MKPQIFLVLLFVAIIFGCEKKNSEVLEEKEKISPLVNDEVEVYFSEKISGKGEKSVYFEGIEKDSVFVIHSAEKFKEIFTDLELPNTIDFNKNIFVIGQKQMPNLFYTITEQFLQKEGNEYMLYLNVSLSEGSYPAFGWLYYWGVYPKIDKISGVKTSINNKN